MPSRVWLVADYKQAEVMVVAWAGPVPSLKGMFQKGEDVHLVVCQRTAKYIQDNNIRMPEVLMMLPDGRSAKRRPFMEKPWDQFTADDPERYTSKRTVHANNYGLGKTKFAIITSLPVEVAGTVQEIYFILFPEVKTNYHAWIDSLLNSPKRTIVVPQGFRRVFYDAPGPELSRAGYAFYPQTTVGLKLVETLTNVCECFVRERLVSPTPWIDSTFGGYATIMHPEALRNEGLNVRLQMHDSLAIALDDDPSKIREAATIIKQYGETPLTIRNQEDILDELVIPMDFKVGPTLKERQSFEEDNPAYLHKYVL